MACRTEVLVQDLDLAVINPNGTDVQQFIVPPSLPYCCCPGKRPQLLQVQWGRLCVHIKISAAISAEFCPQGDSKHVFYCCYLSSEAVKAKSEGLKEKTT